MTPRVRALLAFVLLPVCAVVGQPAPKLRVPLPIETAVALRTHNGRSTVALSPDGQWIAHTIEGVERVPRDTLSRAYSASGFPFDRR